jgi:hypothetical protein
MSSEAKGRAVVAGQVANLKQRAEVMNLSVAQLIQLQDTGQVSNPLPVPAEFRSYLTDQEAKQRAAMTNVQRQPPTAPQVNLPPDHPLYQQALQAAQQQQRLQAQLAAMQHPQAVTHVNELIAPPVAPSVYDQTAAAQLAQFGPPPSDADLSALDALMGASSSDPMMGDEYGTAVRHLQQNAPPPQPKEETPRTFDVESLPPNAMPPRAERPSAVSQLKNPVWRSVDSLLLWESFCACVLEADSHMLRDPAQHKVLKQRLVKFQTAVEEQEPPYALLYLKEIEKRARHRAMLTRRLTALGAHPVTVTRMAQDYQKLLGSIGEAIAAADPLQKTSREEPAAEPHEEPGEG